MKRFSSLALSLLLAMPTACDVPEDELPFDEETSGSAGKSDEAGRSLFSRCATATRRTVAGKTVEFRYESRPFTTLDPVIAVEVQRRVDGGPWTSFGTAELLEYAPGKWVRGNMLAQLQRKEDGALSIRVRHYPDGLYEWPWEARADNGFCETEPLPGARNGEAYSCIAGRCGYSPVGGSYAHELVSYYRPTFAAVLVGGTVTAASPLPGDEVTAWAWGFGTSIVIVAFASAAGAPPDEVVREIADIFGGDVLARGSASELDRHYRALARAAEEEITPVPEYEKDPARWPDGRFEQGMTLMDAINEGTESARASYRCRQDAGSDVGDIYSAWSAIKACLQTARNNGGKIDDVARRVVDALRALRRGPDSCGESNFAEKIDEALCHFYAIFRQIPSSGGAVFRAQEAIRAYFSQVGKESYIDSCPPR